MSINNQAHSEQLYPVQAVIISPDLTGIIRPNTRHGLTYGGEVPRVGEVAVRSLLQETYHFPSMSMAEKLGIEEGVRGFLFRPATGQRLSRDYTWQINHVETLRDHIEDAPDEFDPIEAHFMLEAINKYSRARLRNSQ